MPGSVVTICCGTCDQRVKVDIERAKRELKADREYGYGDHVSDPRAFAMRLLSNRGWRYGGGSGRIAKSTLTMTCPACCGDALTLTADA